MNEVEAKTVAGILGGTAEQMDGNIWVVRFDRPNGTTVIISDDGAARYEPGGWEAKEEYTTVVWWK